MKAVPISRSYFISRAIILTLAVALPVLCWMEFVRWKTGYPFYSHEVVKYRQFVWIFDALKEGPRQFLRALLPNITTYAYATARVALFPLVVLNVLLLVRARTRKGGPFASPKWNPLVAACLTSMLVTVLFFGLLGFYKERLAWNIVPELLVLMAILGHESLSSLSPKGRGLTEALWIIAGAAWLLYEIAKLGPYK